MLIADHSCMSYLWCGLVASDLISSPGTLHLAADGLHALNALVGAHAAVMQAVHLHADLTVLLQ